MELYQLDYILHESREDQGWLYMAEIPDLPGCRAWAETANEALTELSTVAEAVHTLLQGPGQTHATEDSAVTDRRGQDLRGRMTYRELIRKSETGHSSRGHRGSHDSQRVRGGGASAICNQEGSHVKRQIQ